MGVKMKIREVDSFFDPQDSQDGAENREPSALKQGVYFLVDSYLLYLSGRVYRNPQ